MRKLELERYGPAGRELVERGLKEARPKNFNFDAPVSDARAALAALTDQTISPGRRVRMPHDAACCHAALWLLFDFMKESHDLSQNVATPSGSYWHGILHRREPDPSNAKYWFHRVGEHPVFPELLDDAKEIAGALPELKALVSAAVWNAALFTDLCCGNPVGKLAETLLEIQRREWALLFDHNYSKAFAP